MHPRRPVLQNSPVSNPGLPRVSPLLKHTAKPCYWPTCAGGIEAEEPSNSNVNLCPSKFRIRTFRSPSNMEIYPPKDPILYFGYINNIRLRPC